MHYVLLPVCVASALAGGVGVVEAPRAVHQPMLVVVSAPPVAVWDTETVAAAGDTTFPRLTVALVTSFQAVREAVAKLPKAVQDSVPKVPFTPPLPSGVMQGAVASSASLSDWGAFAAQHPPVAAIFRQAHLAPAQYLPLSRAMMAAQTGGALLLVSNQDPNSLDISTVLGQNLQFGMSHQQLMGIVKPTVTGGNTAPTNDLAP